MPLLTEDRPQAYPEPVAADVRAGHVARTNALLSRASKHPVTVIGDTGVLGAGLGRAEHRRRDVGA